MIAPVLIDLSGTIDEFLLSEQETKDLSMYVTTKISDEYYRVWTANVENSSLKQTRSEYLEAMYFQQVDDNTVMFGMSPRKSKLGMMLEEGASAFDIKSGFEKSSKRHFKAGGGWYLTVPFRHATSEAVAESAIYSSIMPKAIEQLAKVSTTALSNADLPEGYKDRRISRAGYKHKAAIYEGLKRQDISSTKNEKRGGYTTFRRVSDQSDKDSWQHPGFQPLKLMEKSLSDINFKYLVDEAVDEFLNVKFG